MKALRHRIPAVVGVSPPTGPLLRARKAGGISTTFGGYCTTAAPSWATSRTAFSTIGANNASNSKSHREISRPISTIPRQAPLNTRARHHPTNVGAECCSRYSTDTSPCKGPTINPVFEKTTQTWQYVIADPATSKAVIIDPVLDYDPATQIVKTESADELLALVKEKGYVIERILETHAHADHLTAASYLQSRLEKIQGKRPPIGIGKRIGQVQKLFSMRYGVPEEEYDGVFDTLFEDDEVFKVGELDAKAIHLPGHTPDHLGYKIGDNVFCGDSIFHHDIGTARCDFPGGSEHDLYTSGRKLFGLPDYVKIWPGHDYPPAGREEAIPWATVAEHKQHNKHLKEGITEDVFVAMRKERDAALGAPRLLHQSLQMNIRAGKLPKQTNGLHRLLHLPMKLNGLDW